MAKNNKRVELFRQRIPLYRKNPVLFCQEVTHFFPEDYQAKFLMDLANNTKVSIKSGHGIGKTGTEANAVLWFLSCFPFARVVATAPTAQQLNDVLWAEINKWIAKSPLLQEILTWTKSYVYIDGYERRWFAVAKSSSKPENMQGYHEDNMLFIVDEASGVEDEIMEAILATLSGDNNKLLMCGNPTRTSGTFYDSFHKDRALYKCHTVSSLDSKRTNKENIEMFRRKYGEHSNVYRVRVLGEFPTQEDDVFIPLPIIERATMNDMSELPIKRISLGVDVARYGDDETIIVQNIGGRVTIPVIRHGQNLMKTVGDIVVQYKEIIRTYPEYKGVITVVIDDTGLGGGVTDRLEEVKREQKLRRMEIVPVNFGSSAPNDDFGASYSGISTYMWAVVRNLLEGNQLQLCDDEDLIAQLSVRKYSVGSNGKIALEQKKDMKKRGLKSPDRADALALSCYTPNRIYEDYIDNAEVVVIPLSALQGMKIMKVNIGISTGTMTKATAFVATAIMEGYKKAVVIASRAYTGAVETDALGKEFIDFVNFVSTLVPKIDYAYCDTNEEVLYRCIKKSLEISKMRLQVRRAANVDVANRVMLTTRLLAQDRLFLTDECDSLSRAMSSASWSDKSSVNTRAEGSETSHLNAFEYTIERFATRFISTEGKEGNDDKW